MICTIKEKNGRFFGFIYTEVLSSYTFVIYNRNHIMKNILFTILLITSICTQSLAQGRVTQTLKSGWKFSRIDDKSAVKPDFDDSNWETVNVPHDWAIYGPFDANNDRQQVAIEQDGQKEAMSHAGRTGGLPFVGVGWYRLNFKVPTFGKGRRTTLLFDGAMSHAEVWVNGEKVGEWPYGYNSFYFDISDVLKEGEENTLAVRLENFEESSRWYPGAGLYRNVHLITTDELAVKTWGTHITTPVINDEYARVHVKVEINIPKTINYKDIDISTEIFDNEGNAVAGCVSELEEYDAKEGQKTLELVVLDPQLWSPETPHLYQAVTSIKNGTKTTDIYKTTFGIRSIEVVPNQGFFLNGKRTSFKGTCNHHDLGPLGTAVNTSAFRRQLRLLKDMGSNAYRTSHNMPAPELIQLCNEMGMMVMAESFDEWKCKKVTNGYNKYYKEWIEKDIVNLVRRYRNDPSVVMWCTGNEVPDQGTADGGKISRHIQDIFHREDPTRPCTQGMDRVDIVLKNGFAHNMDVPGLNYRSHKVQEAYKRLPQEVILGSETASTVSSRGVYKFPVERRSMAMYDDHQSSSYDLEHCSWSDLPEDNFILYEDLPYGMGEFVWTGFDYLGEPTPYYTNWPSHSSLFGIIDLAGLPKDRYYLYRSHWNKKEHTLHILPHWNWEGREGETTPVFVYSDYPTVELFINGKSQGKRTKDLNIGIDETENNDSRHSLTRQKRYRHMWMDTKYEPGTLRAVAYDKDGNSCMEKVVETAGKPYAIELVAEENRALNAGTEDLSFITVRIVDQQGRLCPNAQHLVRFEVKGAGKYRAGANGDPTNLELFHLPQMHVFNGMMTAIIQENGTSGEITLTAKAKGLKSGKLKIVVK